MWRSYFDMVLWAAPLAMALALLVYTPLRLRYKKKHRPQSSARHEAALGLFVVYLAGVAALVWSSGSLYLDNPLANLPRRLATGEGINLVPFFTLRAVWAEQNVGDLLNLFTNVLLFTPFGFLLPFLFPRWRHWHKTIPLGLAAAALIEFVQLFIGRSVDVDDVLLNTLGAALGYGAWRLLHRKVRGFEVDKLALGCGTMLSLLLVPFIAIFLFVSYAFADPVPTYPLADIQPGEVTELWVIRDTNYLGTGFDRDTENILYTNDAEAIYQNRHLISYREYERGMEKESGYMRVLWDGEPITYLHLRSKRPETGDLVLEPISYLYYVLCTGKPSVEIVDEGSHYIVLQNGDGSRTMYMYTGDIKKPETVRMVSSYPSSANSINGFDYSVEAISHTLVEITLDSEDGAVRDYFSRNVLRYRWWFDTNTASLTLMETVYE